MSYVCGEPVVASISADTFVTHVASNSTFVRSSTVAEARIAAVTSDRQIKVYGLNEQSPNGLTFLHSIETRHTDTITGIIFVSPSCIATCSEDGSVKLFDTALIQPNVPVKENIKYTALKFTPLYSIAYSSVNNSILAGGRDGNVYEWSCKTHKLLHDFDYFHSDDVGAVAYNPFNQMQRMTGSNDGTFCLFDTVDADSTEWLQASVNHEVHIERFGLMSDDLLWLIDSNQQIEIYSLATSERMSTWLKPKPDAPANSTPTDIREVMSKQSSVRIDNIIGCEFDPSLGALRVLAGNNNGSLCMFRVDCNTITPLFAHSSVDSTDYFQVEDKDVNVSIDAGVNRMENDEKHQDDEKSDAMDADDEAMAVDSVEQPAPKPLVGHVEQIRDVVWLNSGSLMITVGNDGRICVWKQTVASPQNHTSGKQRKNRNKTFSPY